MNGPEGVAEHAAPPLFVLCCYRGADRDGPLPGSRWALRLGVPQWVGHRRVHRDFYANPRDLRYQLALVAQQMPGARAPRLVIDRRLAAAARDIPGLAKAAFELADLDEDRLADSVIEAEAAADDVYLVYPDAIGLGCEAIEAALLRRAKGRCWVVNGRRRVFRLTSGTRRRLAVSRWLARTRAVEYAAALALTAAGYLLAEWDHLRGRR